MKPIRIATPRDFIEQQHTLCLYCRACDRWVDVDLRRLIDMGRGDQPIQVMRFVCRECGAGMDKQVRPPTMRP